MSQRIQRLQDDAVPIAPDGFPSDHAKGGTAGGVGEREDVNVQKFSEALPLMHKQSAERALYGGELDGAASAAIIQILIAAHCIASIEILIQVRPNLHIILLLVFCVWYGGMVIFRILLRCCDVFKAGVKAKQLS